AISITTAIGNRYVPGEPVTFLVSISATKATNGNVIVRMEGRETARAGFEVAGGATKTVVVVSETLQWGGGIAVVVNSDDGNRTFRPALAEDREGEQVGLLPSLQLAELPNTAPTATGGRTARFHPITEQILRSDPRALEMYDSIAGSPDDFAAMADEALTAVQSWTARGGSLIVDAPPGTTVRGFEADSSARFLEYGFGTIRYSDDSFRRGNVTGVVPATGLFRFDEFDSGIDPSQSGRILVADAGITTPGIGALLALIAVYIVLVGPVLFLLLRQLHRQPLAWLAIPGLAALAVGLVWGVGRAQRSDVDFAHGTIVAYVDRVRIERSEVLVAASSGGFVGVETAEGFVSVGGTLERWGEVTGRVLERRDDSVGLRLNPGEASRLTVERVTVDPEPPPLVIGVKIEGNRRLSGTLTNRSALVLEDVRVVAGNAVQLVGRLDPGQAVEVALDDGFATIPITQDSLFDRMQQGFFDPFGGAEVDEGAVNAGVLAGFTRRFRESRATGHVMALGWTREVDAPVRSHEGGTIDRGRTGFVTFGPIGFSDDPAVEYGESVASLQRIWDFELNDRTNGFAEFPSEILYALPADSDPAGAYVAELSQDVVALDIWNGSSWEPSSDRRLSGTSVVPLPPDAVRNGQVHLRAGFGVFEQTSIPVVRSATPEEIAAAS
ncbi:MAG: hypothetical protein KJN63_00805, partial [Acidimicrobiia bacterium]|nr:hypothetical protein [Acidimicrobiia bacterium]